MRKKIPTLHEAILGGDPYEVQDLVDRGFPLDQRDPEGGRTPLFVAAEMGRPDLAVILVAANASLEAANPEGRTPLHAAAMHGHLDMVKFLLQMGADGQAADKYGETPFFVAAAEGQPDVIQFFLANGHSPEPRNHATFTPLHHLARHTAEFKITRITVTHKGKKYVISDPKAVAEHLENSDPFDGKYARLLQTAETLIAGGAQVDAPTDTNNTPLHFAATYGPLELVELLLANGADVNAQDADGLTPLHFATRSQKLPVATALVEAGAQVNAQDKYGFTPLHEAAEQGKLSRVRYLMEQGADHQAKLTNHYAKFKKGSTPRDVALAAGHPKVARWIEKLVDVLGK